MTERFEQLKANIKKQTPEQIQEKLKELAEEARLRKKANGRITCNIDLGLGDLMQPLPKRKQPLPKRKLVAVPADHTLLGDIGQHLGFYENIKYLYDMSDIKDRTADWFDGEEDMELRMADVAESMRRRGLESLRKLVANHVQADRVDEAYDWVVGHYDADWHRYTLDKEAGFIQPGSEDYDKYLWRGTGPKPYFMGLIETYLKRKPKKYRSIDDPGDYIGDHV